MKGMGNRKAAAAAVTGIFGICLAAAGVRTAGGAGLSASTQDLTAEYRRGDGTMQEEYRMEQEFRESYMEFSLALLKYCRGEGRNGVSGENVLVSPVSVITAVGMAETARKGKRSPRSIRRCMPDLILIRQKKAFSRSGGSCRGNMRALR